MRESPAEPEHLDAPPIVARRWRERVTADLGAGEISPRWRTTDGASERTATSVGR
jgi:hypothetical protein